MKVYENERELPPLIHSMEVKTTIINHYISLY